MIFETMESLKEFCLGDECSSAELSPVKISTKCYGELVAYQSTFGSGNPYIERLPKEPDRSKVLTFCGIRLEVV